ncbi:MAG: PadR family transcriptional regulator [Solirubrobacterales bacterium]
MNTETKPESYTPVADADLAPSAYMLMAMIRDGYDTGYGIKRFIERAASFFWSVSYGQIYPELRRLESAGMIRGRDVTENGRRRREYSLTAAGKGELRRWLADPAEPAMWMRNEGMLRLMLVDWEADPELVRKNIAEYRRMTADRLEAIRALEPPRDRGRRIQDLGTRILEETVRWCEETEADLA